MERKFYNDEFEGLIRQKADHYKMYPSDKVWKNINASLHTRRKWFIAGMFTLISGFLFIAAREFLFIPGPPNNFKKIASLAEQSPVPENSIIASAKSTSIFKSGKTGDLPNTTGFMELKSIVPEEMRTEDSDISAASSEGVLSFLQNLKTNEESLTLANVNSQETENGEDYNFAFKWRRNFYQGRTEPSTLEKSWSPEEQSQTVGVQKPADQVKSGSAAQGLDRSQMDLLNTQAPYNLVSTHKLNRKYFEFYASPIVTYRSLSGEAIANLKTNVQNGPIAATSPFSNPNFYTNNKPALGFEIGTSLLYRFTRNLSFKAGFQFNYSKYTIEAYASNPQSASIALNSYNGYPGNLITSYTNIGTIGGDATVNLENQYFQLSIPLGFELRVIGNEKLQFNIAATIQPTYLLNRNSYLLTSDYTNYTQEPSLFRRWNANGAIEAFVSYNVGKVRWQIGPQFRYQIFSTYSSDYPINENLKGVGVKLGLSKTIW